MIIFLGQCVQNFVEAVKYTFKGNVTFKSVVSQAAKIGFDSLGISLMIVLIASSVIALQVSKQFLLSGDLKITRHNSSHEASTLKTSKEK